MNLFGLHITTQQRETMPTAGGQADPHEHVGKVGDIAPSVIHASGEHSSLTVSALYAAVSRRAQTMAQLPIHYQYYSRKDDCFRDGAAPRDRRLNYLLQVCPNPYMNATVLWRLVEVQRILRGNAYIYVERGADGDIAGFWLCQSATFEPIRRTYTITYYLGTVVTTRDAVPADDVLHFRNTMLWDGERGVSLLQYAARTLNTAATLDNLALDTAAKGGRKKLVLQEKEQQTMGLGRTPKKEMETIRQKLQQDLWDGNHDVTYVPNVAAIQDISQSLAELELTANRKLSVVDIARFTGVPKVFLGDESNSNYKSMEDAQIDFFTSTIGPNIAEIEDELNSKLLSESEYGLYRFHITEDRLFRLNRAAQGVWNKNRLETGIASVNELRHEQNLPRLADGDTHYVSTNLAVMGSNKLSYSNYSNNSNS